MKMRISRTTKKVLLSVLLAAGILLFLYPFVSDHIHRNRQRSRVSSYEQQTDTLTEEQIRQLWKAAEQYNQKLAETGIRWDLADDEKILADSYLNTSDDGCIGYLTIPEIDVCLPIYHGTDADTLRNGVGHIEGTSLPIGGANTHTVLTGHRGLPSSRLLLHLDRLKKGSIFSITVLGQTMNYKVTQILTVDPSDVSPISIEKEKDLCTLVTCTPYGLNTERLLVQGERTDRQDTSGD